MRHRRLFEELIDMQAEANTFFDDVYNRLSMFNHAMAGWNARGPETSDSTSPQGTFERTEKRWMGHGGQNIITECYERQIYISSDSPTPIESYRAAQPSHQLNRSVSHPLPPANQTALPSPGRNSIRLPESKGEVLARIEISTLKPGDVEITLNHDSLTITGKVYRKVMLPPGVDPAQVHAVYQDGALEIRSDLPERARKVEIVFE